MSEESFKRCLGVQMELWQRAFRLTLMKLEHERKWSQHPGLCPFLLPTAELCGQDYPSPLLSMWRCS